MAKILEQLRRYDEAGEAEGAGGAGRAEGAKDKKMISWWGNYLVVCVNLCA
ncbi:MAG: hypothetical protein RID53_31490 [Coleofasciculus sp. B1-GNL1-01]|uniref:hypothetical protein n=1 Tax=Coleofasciculus sp. B1-GNL1-01 TaxID=3068484 RepID=UPI0032FFB073